MAKEESSASSAKKDDVTKTIRLSETEKEAVRTENQKLHEEGKLKLIYLPMDDLETEKLEVAVRVPSRATISQYMRFVDANPKKAQEILLNQCVLSSNKKQINDDDALFFTAVSAISELIPIRNATIKNF